MAGISTAGEIRTAAEGLQDIRSKISRCLENASHCASSRYIFFLSVAQTTTWPNPQIWNSFYFPCHPLTCFSSTRPHCLRVTGQCLLFNEGEKKNAPVFLFNAWVLYQKKIPTYLDNVLSPSPPKELLSKASSLEHSWVPWLQMARFDCSGVWMQGFA